MQSARKIFIFCDGTACDEKNGTNVQFLREFISPPPTDEYYLAGVGARSFTFNLDIVLAPQIRSMACNLYRTVAAMGPKPNDRIFIIGYSRGALIARMLAMAIVDQVFRTKLFENDRLHSAFEMDVWFLGLFDPVLGNPFPWSLPFDDKQAATNKRIKNYVELLAADERRPHFKSKSSVGHVEKASPVNLFKIIEKNVYRNRSKHDVISPSVEAVQRLLLDADAHEVMSRRHFLVIPGVHSDIGGQDGDLILSSASALAMINFIVGSDESLSQLINSDSYKSLCAKADGTPILRMKSNDWWGLFLRRRYPQSNRISFHPMFERVNGAELRKLLVFWKKSYKAPHNFRR